MKRKIYLGIDIGGTSAKFGIVDENGNIICKAVAAVDFDGYETPILETVKSQSRKFLEEQKIEPQELSGIGVSATGQINTRKGIVAGTAGHIKNWDGSRIKDELEEMYGVYTTVVNDANCAALGEYWIGAARDFENVAVVTIGTGIGGGIITDGKLLLGAQGAAGELGHFTIDFKGKKCACGNTGCYEQYASTTALLKMVRGKIVAGELSAFSDTIDGKSIFTELGQGNKELEEIVDEWINYVAIGLASLVHIFNPSLILIGGGVSAQQELFIDKLREKVIKNIMPMYRLGLRIEKAVLENNAGLVGAVYYCMTAKQK